MDDTKYLREDQWERIKESLPDKAGDVGRKNNGVGSLFNCTI